MRIIDCYNILLQAELVKAAKIIDEGNSEVSDLEYNSRKASEGTLFFCKGENFKSEYLIEAVDKGSICYVAENIIKGGSAHKPSVIIVKDIRKAMAVLSKAVYFPDETKMKIIGITGTKGKSTTIYMLKTIFNEYLKGMGKSNCAFISGIEIDDGTGLLEAELTTPETIDLYKHIATAVKLKKEFMIIEVSSQALKYGRCDYLSFDISGFLNISHDHISPKEHPDFEDYYNSKIKIFDVSKSTWMNSDSIYFDKLLSYASQQCEVNTYGKAETDKVKLVEFSETIESLNMKVDINGEILNLNVSIGGEFNVSNVLCAISIAYKCNIPFRVIANALNKVYVPGRMEIFKAENDKIIVIVDFAHNSISYEKMFQHVKKNYPNRKIAITFGCRGEKALNRRKDLGEISSKYADRIYLVPNIPRNEDYREISKETQGYMYPGPEIIEMLDSREEGILKALKGAKDSNENWVVLVLGKGREKYKKLGSKEEDTNDYEVVKELLQSI